MALLFKFKTHAFWLLLLVCFIGCKAHDPITEIVTTPVKDSIPKTAVVAKTYKKDLRVFVIGNSFSQGATTYIGQLCYEGGHGIEVGRAELGGCSLQTHWELAAEAEANPNGAKGKAYNGKSLKELLSVGKWDVVTIQQYSMHSSFKDSYQPYANNLYKYIKSIQPDAEVVIHQTWAYRADDILFGQISATKHASNDQEMYANLKANYLSLAGQLKLGVMPVGEAFWQMRNNTTWAFVPKDLKSQTYGYPVLPAQVNSLHVGYYWNGDKTLGYDGNHANSAGKYLGSLVWYHYLFGEDVTKVVFRPAEVSQPFAEQLKLAANKAFAAIAAK
jgi:hypothetical protein